MSTEPATDLGTEARRVREEAAGILADLAGGASLCTIARSGRAFAGGKYHEGRMAAAGAVLRIAAEQPDPELALEAARVRWASLSPLERRTTSDWEAYGAGGDDALAELAAAVPSTDAS